MCQRTRWYGKLTATFLKDNQQQPRIQTQLENILLQKLGKAKFCLTCGQVLVRHVYVFISGPGKCVRVRLQTEGNRS